MIRKATINLDYANTGKKEALKTLLTEYNRVVNCFIDYLWEKQQFTGKFVKETKWLTSNLSARLRQAAAKQALAIVKSQRKKTKKTKPVFNKLTMELDSRFLKFEAGENSFDLWLTLASLGNKLKLVLPSRKHKQFNKFYEAGWSIKPAVKIRLSNNKSVADIYFQKASVPNGKTDIQAVDIGYKTLLADNQGNLYGRNLEPIYEKISRKQQGSKAFKRALIERDNEINKTVKELNLVDYGYIALEALKDVKKNTNKTKSISKKFMNKLQRWSYSKVISRIQLTAEELGVQVLSINPRNTSRTCPSCGTIDKSSRSGELFKCVSCNYENNADTVGALNILNRAQLLIVTEA